MAGIISATLTLIVGIVLFANKASEGEVARAVVSPTPSNIANVLGTEDTKLEDVSGNLRDEEDGVSPPSSKPVVSTKTSVPTTTVNNSLPTPTSSASSTPQPTLSPQSNTGPSQTGTTTLEIVNGNDITVVEPDGRRYAGVHNQKVSQGTSVSTGSATQAQLVYVSGSVVRLEENTRVVVTKEASSTDGGGVAVESGSTWQRIKKLLGGETPFESTSNQVVATVRGTSYGHLIEVGPDGQRVDRILLAEGKVSTRCQDEDKNNPANLLELKVNFEAKVNCKLVGNARKTQKELGKTATKKELKWVLENLEKDERLKERFKDIVYYDQDTPPIDVKGNKAPTADAGKNQTIVLPVLTTTLNGSGTDKDKLPFDTDLLFTWEQVMKEGDKNAVIEDPTQKNTKVTFPGAGEYRFKLTVSDTDKSDYKEVVIKVNYPTPKITKVIKLFSECDLTCMVTVKVTGSGYLDGIMSEAVLDGNKKAGSVIVTSFSEQTIVFTDLPKNKQFKLRTFYATGVESTLDKAFDTK